MSTFGHELGITKGYKLGPFHDGLALKFDEAVKRYGYVDKHFNWVIKPTFLNAKDFSEGKAPVCFFNQQKYDSQAKKVNNELESAKFKQLVHSLYVQSPITMAACAVLGIMFIYALLSLRFFRKNK